MTKIPESDVAHRVEQHAVEIASLAEGQKQLGQNLDRVVLQMSRGFEATTSQVNKLADKLDEDRTKTANASRTNWPVLFGCFAVVTALLGYYSDSRIKPVETSIQFQATLIAEMRQELVTRTVKRYDSDMAAADKTQITALIGAMTASNDARFTNLNARNIEQDGIISKNHDEIIKHSLFLELMRSGELKLKQ